MAATLKEKIRTFIIDNFLFGAKDARVGDDQSFLESGIIDSTGVLELVSYVEESFAVEVKDEDLVPDNFDSISKLAAYIQAKVGERRPQEAAL